MNLLLIIWGAISVVTTITPIVYTFWFKWHKTTLGRALFLQSLALALVVNVSWIRFIRGEDWYWFRTGLFVVLFIAQAGVLAEMTKIKMSSSSLEGVEGRMK